MLSKGQLATGATGCQRSGTTSDLVNVYLEWVRFPRSSKEVAGEEIKSTATSTDLADRQAEGQQGEEGCECNLSGIQGQQPCRRCSPYAAQVLSRSDAIWRIGAIQRTQGTLDALDAHSTAIKAVKTPLGKRRF